jgi:magnesium transporter
MHPDNSPTFVEKVHRYLKQNNPSHIRRLLARHNFADIADVFEYHLSQEEVVYCFQHLNVGKAAQVLAGLNTELQSACLASMPTALSSKILRQMAADDAVDILQEMNTSDSQKILEEMPFDTDTRTLHYLMMEAPDTAAGIMSTDYIQLSVESTVAEAMQLLRQAKEKDFIYYVYLVDGHNHLVGVVSIKQLFLVDESVPLSKIGEFDVKSLLVNYDQEFVAKVFRKYYNLLAMPVTDPDNTMRGIITIDDIIDVIEESTSEDIYKASGINIEDVDERGLLVGPEIRAFKARFPFLSISMAGQFLTSTIIAHFSHTVSAAVVAISFMPLLTGLSGSIGTQSETITVRGLALNLITDQNIVALVLRELRVSLIIGSCFAVTVGILSFMLYHNPYLSMLLAFWILGSQCAFACVGMLIPYGVSRIFKVDPAGMGGPLITTVSDILTFFTYLSVVTLFLSKLQ